MQQFIKSFFSLGVAVSLFSIKQIENLLTPTERDAHKGPATQAMDSVRNATLDQLGGTLRGTFSALDNIQRGVVSAAFVFWPAPHRNATQFSHTMPLRNSAPVIVAEPIHPTTQSDTETLRNAHTTKPARTRNIRTATHGASSQAESVPGGRLS